MLAGFLGWKSFSSGKTNGKKAYSVAGSSAIFQPASATFSSRMIEAETPLLAAKDNAANDWRKAFTLAAKLNDREKAILNDYGIATDEELAALLANIRLIILLLRSGAAKPGCDWGNSDSSNTRFQYIDQAHFLAALANFDAYQRVLSEPEEALENLKAMERLGNSLDQGFAVAFIQQQFSGFLAEHSGSLLPAIRSHPEWLPDENAFAQALQKSFQSEANSVKQGYKQIEAGKKIDGQAFTKEQTNYIASHSGRTAEEIHQSAERYQTMAAALEKMIYMPDDEFQRWVADLQVANPLPDGVEDDGKLASYTITREMARQALVSRAMIRASLSMMGEGVSATDPLTGKVFAYRKIDDHGSFELKSEVLYQGKPVALTFWQKPM